jgi:hypothetical protein
MKNLLSAAYLSLGNDLIVVKTTSISLPAEKTERVFCCLDN